MTLSVIWLEGDWKIVRLLTSSRLSRLSCTRNLPRRLNYSERARATKFAKTTRIEKVGSRAATSVSDQSETSYSVPLHITSHSIVG